MEHFGGLNKSYRSVIFVRFRQKIQKLRKKNTDVLAKSCGQ